MQRPFGRLWLGQAVSSVGDQLFPVAIAVLVVERHHGSPGELGLVLGARALAGAIFVIVGGAWADRVRRTRLMIATDVVRGAAVLALALAPITSPTWILAACTFVLGAGEAFFRPAFRSLIPSVVADDRVAEANATTNTALQAAAFIGPAAAGLMVSTVGVRWTLLVNAATFLVSTLTLVEIADPPIARSHTSVAAQVREGIVVLAGRRWAAAVLVVDAAHILFAVAPWFVLLPVIMLDRFGDPSAYGAVASVFAAGGIAGALAAARWRPRRKGTVALLAQATFSACLLILAFTSSVPALVVAAGIAGVGGGISNVFWMTSLHEAFPDVVLGRVMALSTFGSLALMPLGLALAGPIATVVGDQAVLAVGAAVVIGTTLVVLRVPGVARLSSGDTRQERSVTRRARPLTQTAPPSP
jgi:DHA3 family tetracycline resistance protein-like MFS transporter